MVTITTKYHGPLASSLTTPMISSIAKLAKKTQLRCAGQSRSIRATQLHPRYATLRNSAIKSGARRRQARGAFAPLRSERLVQAEDVALEHDRASRQIGEPHAGLRLADFGDCGV